MTRRPIIAGNWKMNLTPQEALRLAGEVRDRCARFRNVDVVIAPSTLAAWTIAERLSDSPINVAVQTCHWADKGAYTGELAPPQIKSAGIKYAIIGHSERRQYFGETNEGVGKKARALHDHGVIPIICVGESLAEREAGQTVSIVTAQLDAAIAELSDDEIIQSVLAYEPVWAIGTGRTATPAQAQEVHAALRARVATLRGKKVAISLRIQYGGSVKPANVVALMSEPDIDGALVGGASLTADSFARIVGFREGDN